MDIWNNKKCWHTTQSGHFHTKKCHIGIFLSFIIFVRRQIFGSPDNCIEIRNLCVTPDIMFCRLCRDDGLVAHSLLGCQLHHQNSLEIWKILMDLCSREVLEDWIYYYLGMERVNRVWYQREETVIRFHMIISQNILNTIHWAEEKGDSTKTCQKLHKTQLCGPHYNYVQLSLELKGKHVLWHLWVIFSNKTQFYAQAEFQSVINS